jgi:hypothetical protein
LFSFYVCALTEGGGGGASMRRGLAWIKSRKSWHTSNAFTTSWLLPPPKQAEIYG